MIMVVLILVTGLFNGSYNPFSSSLITSTPMDIMLPMEPKSIGNRSATAIAVADEATQRTRQRNISLMPETPIFNKDLLKQQQQPKTNGDALFHHQSAFYVERSPPVSGVHCLGETFTSEAFLVLNATAVNPMVNIDTKTPFVYRSCSFQNLCYDVDSKEFLLISSPTSQAANNAMSESISPRFRQVYRSVSWENNTVSLSPLAQRWTEEERSFFEWFPKIVQQKDIQGYYQLDPNLVLVPFAMHGASNPGHAVWDNFLPIYKLLTMFDLCWKNPSPDFNGTTSTKAMPLLVEVPTNKFIFGACNRQHKVPCTKMFRKLLPLLGLRDDHLVNTKEIRLETTPTTSPKSSIVCARAGAAGLGMLSDHATKEHGQTNADYAFIHNSGKSELVFQYRNFVMKNMGLYDRNDLPRNNPPYRITIATNSSDDPKRLLLFEKPVHAIEDAFSPDQIVVKTYVMRHLPLVEQLRVASESFFYLSACGGSVMTATFLPRGASLVLFYANTRYQKLPSFLDFDLLNNLSYIRVHWFSKTLLKKQDMSDLLILLIREELDYIML